MSLLTVHLTRSPRRRAVAVALSTSLLAVACGGGEDAATPTTADAGTADEVLVSDEPDQTTTTATPAPDEETTTTQAVVAETTTTTEASTTTAASQGATSDTLGSAVAGLQPGIGLVDMQQVVADIPGPTDDVTAVARRLGEFPDIPTLDGSSVIGVQAEMYRFGEENLKHTYRMEYWTPTPFAESLALVEAGIVDLGYEVTGTSSQSNSDGSEAGRIEADLPDSGDVTRRNLIITARSGDFDGTKIEFWFQGDTLYVDQLALHGTWVDSAPLPDGAEHRSVRIVITPVGDPSSPDRYWANSSAFWHLEGEDLDGAAASVESVLASGGDYLLDGTIENGRGSLVTDLFQKDADVLVQESGDTAIVTVTGKWDLEG